MTSLPALLALTGCLPDYPDWQAKTDIEEADDTSTDDTGAPDDTGDTGCDPLYTTWPDADGDGYGDAGADAATGCEIPPGHVEQGGDCDDSNPDVWPGAVELCDEVRNDCDDADWSGDDGVVSFQRSVDSAWTDLTGQLSKGAAGEPAAWTTPEAGQLRFCPGEWFVNLEATADLIMAGYPDAASVILSGGGVDSVVKVRAGADSVFIELLTLTGGVGTETGGNGKTAGGGLYCFGGAELIVSQSVITQNDAQNGAGIYLDGCGLQLIDSSMTFNEATYGGGLFAAGEGALSITDVTFQKNTAWAGGGAFLAPEGKATPWLERVTFTSNTAYSDGAGLYLYGNGAYALSAPNFDSNRAEDAGGGLYLADRSQVTIAGPTFSANSANTWAGAIYMGPQTTGQIDDATFTGNFAADGGAFYLLDAERLEVTASDFSGNSPNDVSSSGSAYGYGENTDFICQGRDCWED